MKNKKTAIKVLNIAQPHAHNVIFNRKNIENRSKVTHLRGTIAIYASATYNKKRFEGSDVKKEDCEFGYIIGFVDVVDCIVAEEVTKSTQKWFYGPYGYVLKNPRALKEPIAVKPPQGAIIWWELEGKKASECLKQIEANSYHEPVKTKPDPSKPRAKVITNRSMVEPSKDLAKLVGKDPIKMKKIYDILAKYVDEKGLGFEDEDGDFFVETDQVLKPIFNEEVIYLDEIRPGLENSVKLVS